jgi:hypothetical protein
LGDHCHLGVPTNSPSQKKIGHATLELWHLKSDQAQKSEKWPQFWVNVTLSFENKPSHKMDWAIIAVLACQHAHQVGQ